MFYRLGTLLLFTLETYIHIDLQTKEDYRQTGDHATRWTVRSNTYICMFSGLNYSQVVAVKNTRKRLPNLV